jgi:hypothetical protein
MAMFNSELLVYQRLSWSFTKKIGRNSPGKMLEFFRWIDGINPK